MDALGIECYGISLVQAVVKKTMLGRMSVTSSLGHCRSIGMPSYGCRWSAAFSVAERMPRSMFISIFSGRARK